MKKIGDITNTADKNGEFTDGNVAAGTPPTQLMGAWFNSVQREILNVLVKAGIPQSATKEDQLAAAIEKLIGSASYLPTGYSYSKVESNLKFQPIGSYQPSGDYATNTVLNNGLALKFDKTGVAQTVGSSTTLVMSQDAATKLFLTTGSYGLGSSSSPSPSTYAKDWNKNGFYVGNVNNSSSVVFGISCNHMNSLYGLNIYGRNQNIYFSTRENGEDAVIDGKFHTSANTTIDRSGYLRSSSSTVEMQSVPIGSSLIWNTTAPIPENFWPHEGRAFSATEYPELAKIFPTLKLPDDRGYGIRIADNGRGIDIGRTVGTYQEDAIQNIVGEIQANIGGSASGVFSFRANGSRAEGGLPTGGAWKFDASTVARTANETRMKNVAKILITRVK